MGRSGSGTRDHIVDTTLKMISEIESHNVRISEVAKRSSVGVPTIYYYFESRTQLLAEAAATTPFMAMDELARRIERGDPGLIVLDVRERDAFAAGHIPGARHLPRGQLELRVDKDLPDPTARILTCCEFGRISTLAAATLRSLGFPHACALDGGVKAWREAGFPFTEPE